MAYSYSSVNKVYKLDAQETVLAAGKTICPALLVFCTGTAGDDLVLTDGNDEIFAAVSAGQYIPAVIPFPEGTELDGLKVATIDGGFAYLYLARK